MAIQGVRVFIMKSLLLSYNTFHRPNLLKENDKTPFEKSTNSLRLIDCFIKFLPGINKFVKLLAITL